MRHVQDKFEIVPAAAKLVVSRIRLWMCPSQYCLGLERDVCKTPLTVFGVSLPALSPDQQRQM